MSTKDTGCWYQEPPRITKQAGILTPRGGVRRRATRVAPAQPDTLLRIAVDAGWQQADLTRILGLSATRIQERVSRAHCTPAPSSIPAPPAAAPRHPGRSGYPTHARPRVLAATPTIVAGYQAGASMLALAYQTGLSECTVYRVLEHHGIPRRTRGPAPRAAATSAGAG